MEDYYFWRARTENDLRNYETAIESSSKAIEINPAHSGFIIYLPLLSDNKEYFNERGGAYLMLRRYEEALENFSHSIKIGPSVGQAYYNRGRCYKETNRFTEALNDLTIAVALLPDISGFVHWH